MKLITIELVDRCGGFMACCSECGAETDVQIELGAPYADEPGGWFCRPCLLKALALMDGEKEPENEA